jgi:hypothetical protein
MFQIEGITEEPTQSYRLPVENSGIEAEMIIRWRETQNSWFMDVSYDTFSVKNIRMCAMPNLLTQFANRIPFGLLLASDNGQDPLIQQSFSDGTCTLYILTAAEVADLESNGG